MIDAGCTGEEFLATKIIASYDIRMNEADTSVIVEFDLEEYRRKHNSKAVKKTLSILQWLNEEATAMYK